MLTDEEAEKLKRKLARGVSVLGIARMPNEKCEAVAQLKQARENRGRPSACSRSSAGRQWPRRRLPGGSRSRQRGAYTRCWAERLRAIDGNFECRRSCRLAPFG